MNIAKLHKIVFSFILKWRERHYDTFLVGIFCTKEWCYHKSKSRFQLQLRKRQYLQLLLNQFEGYIAKLNEGF